ncbi:MAG TPA: class I SAM-dependent methyltransferase [Candidatus Kryptonia bacterium]|nr:class I SAM-dependent methyltransferase [Candidatus Kryptonia bacterium]
MTASLSLVCPACHSALTSANSDGCRCERCGAIYPKRAAVEVFLTDDEWRACRERIEREHAILERYEFARRQVALTVMYYDWWIARMFAEIPSAYTGPLVELMCGGAEVCRRLPARFTSAVALDVDVAMVEHAARDLRNAGEQRVTVVCGTAGRLPLPDQCTGAVVIQGALHHARPILSQILAEVHRVLTPGGVFVGSEPANDHPLTRMIRHWQYRRSHLQGNDPDEDGFARPELAAVLSDAGLRLDRYRQFGFIAYPLMGNTDEIGVLAHSRRTGLGHALLALDAALEHVPIIRGLAWASLFRAFKPA